MLGFNGGLLGVRKEPSQARASGIWLPNEQSVARRANQWPLGGVVPVGSIAYSQSSVYGGVQPADNLRMTGGSFLSTVTATNNGSLEWVRMDLGAPYPIDRVIVGTATNRIPGGWSKFYTENKSVEHSLDGTNWTFAFDTGLFSTEGIYTFSVNFIAQFIRIVDNGDWVALSEFYALSPGQTYVPPGE